MKYKLLLVLFLFGCSSDLAPDLSFKYDICLDELSVAVYGLIVKCFEIMSMVVQFCISNFILPTIELASWILSHLTHYFRHNVHIWLLFFRHSFMYRHSDYGVRSYYCFTRTFFVRGVYAATCVLVVLISASLLDTEHLFGYGKFTITFILL